MKEHEQLVRRYFSYVDGKWPKDQMSGIIFFEGEKITIEEFAAYKAIYDLAVS